MKAIDNLCTHLQKVDTQLKKLGLMHETVYLEKRYSESTLKKVGEKIKPIAIEADDYEYHFALKNCDIRIRIKGAV